jgi:hypothetical protein
MATKHNRVISLIVFFLILLFATNIEAKKVLSEQELKEKIIDKKILDMHLSDEGIAATGLSQYGSPDEEDFIVPGSYDKIPDDIHKLARRHGVTILASQASRRAYLYRSLVPIGGWILNIIIFGGILVVLIIINKKVSRILKIMNKTQ